MESWRVIATALLGVAGLVLVLLTMAKVRDRTGRSGTVAISGAVSFTGLALLCVLTVTVLPAGVVWGAVIVVGVVTSALLLVG
ncbi:4-amino-4-deoxy-L-arabinose transferase-like glycosyltransferase [Actinokineospora baliensis]|uniref:hypothetical protein n=1 Tax=Actinokineospora baliensis TaxID=547056 RepID=UPI001959846E|nr:hypothetical protein [Actinokineospora baliensis]MBM7771369.1 4-amino-4-deoxy-L-arabinose transferase-like glycosyltransferase [Actinokineospora baliensis]